MTAVKGGKSVDTSMGYTPLAGLIMGTRSGDIDPSALTTILIREGIDGARLDTILNKESGLLALAGSNDMRKVVEAAQSGDERAQLALDMTSYRLMKYIGGYNLVVGGAQALIFTAGIGENSGDFRKLVLDASVLSASSTTRKRTLSVPRAARDFHRGLRNQGAGHPHQRGEGYR